MCVCPADMAHGQNQPFITRLLQRSVPYTDSTIRGHPKGDVDFKAKPIGKFHTTSRGLPPRRIAAEMPVAGGSELVASCVMPFGAPETMVQSGPCCTENMHINGPRPAVPS